MRNYEGLFILNLAGHEDGLKETIDRLSGEITKLGAKIETVQKMEKRPFARAADRKVKEGFYVNFIFAAEPDVADALAGQFDLDEDVYRVLVTHAQPAPPPVAAR